MTAASSASPSTSDVYAEAEGLCAFVDASPSPFHACAEVATRLEAAGFSLLDEADRWPRDPGRYYILRGGSLVAWSTEAVTTAGTPFRIVGAHTDSPNLRIKPHPDTSRAGWQLLAAEPYGGPLLNSWLDRDLGLSGRVSVRASEGVEERLLKVDRPILRVPQLAIHLDREIRETGVKLNPQQHVFPVWGVGTSPGDFSGFVAEELKVEPGDILGGELMTHDLAPSRRIGRDGDLMSAPRLDNLGTTYSGLRALLRAVEAPGADIPVLVLFDHEEVGSVSERGAASTLLPHVLERIVLAAGGDREDLLRALAGSICASGDMAHATHPNYPERHEPHHQIRINGGPVLKINVNLRYATDARGAGAFAQACEQAGVPMQRFVNRADLPCGSTVGPITAAGVGVTTVDVGAPQLAMHSAREMCGAADPGMYVAALAAFLAPAG
ncbi:M18 family aminopeptidase [Actinopolymorpha alba]|uniref:M18 family aminopeptidase n=1 Tax=Actinopolymorpha alba TaxID=533267 RepID=UPI0003663890|nr:M18 family aminopeptidase [Actinopolymorpha alba]